MPLRLINFRLSVNGGKKILWNGNAFSQNIPIILEGTKSDFSISDKMLVTNYHGFARRILKRYGYKIHSGLLEVDRLQSVDDSYTKNLMQSISGLSYQNAEILSKFNNAVKTVDGTYIKENIATYNNTVITELLPFRTSKWEFV